MGIVRDNWKEPTSKAQYISADKEPKEGKELKPWEYVLWSLAQEMETKFGFGPSTLLEIYRAVGTEFGWTDQDTRDTLRRAVLHGYVIKIGKEKEP